MVEERSTLSVLETLSVGADVPQRAIAARTGLNLAKVNFVLRKCIDKGFVKLKRIQENPHKLRYMYLLTAEGMAEKSRLTYAFVQRTLQEYRQVEKMVADNVESMLAQGVRRVVLWGHNEVTNLCQELIERMGKDGLLLLGVVDPTGRHPKAIHPSRLASLEMDVLVVCDGESNGIPTGYPIWKLV